MAERIAPAYLRLALDASWDDVGLTSTLLFADEAGRERKKVALELDIDEEVRAAIAWSTKKRTRSDLFRDSLRRDLTSRTLKQYLGLARVHIEADRCLKSTTLSGPKKKSLEAFAHVLEFALLKEEGDISSLLDPENVHFRRYRDIVSPVFQEWQTWSSAQFVQLFASLNEAEDEFTQDFDVSGQSQSGAASLLEWWWKLSWSSPLEVVKKSLLGPYIKHGQSLIGSYRTAKAMLDELLLYSPFLSSISLNRRTDETCTVPLFLEIARRQPADKLWPHVHKYHLAFVAWRFTSTLSHFSQNQIENRFAEGTAGKVQSAEAEFRVLAIHCTAMVSSIEELVQDVQRNGDHFLEPARRCAEETSPELELLRLQTRLTLDLMHDALKRLEIMDRHVAGTQELQGAHIIRRVIRYTNHRGLYTGFCRLLLFSTIIGTGLRRYWLDTLLRIATRFLTNRDLEDLFKLFSYEANSLLPKSASELINKIFGIEAFASSELLTRAFFLQDRAWAYQGLSLATTGRNQLAKACRVEWLAVQGERYQLVEALKSARLKHSLVGLEDVLSFQQRVAQCRDNPRALYPETLQFGSRFIPRNDTLIGGLFR